jgi:hypothetical protein
MARGGAVDWGTARQTGRVVGSIPNGYLEIFIEKPSGLTVASGLTQPLTKMNTRNISWGVKAAGA